MDRVRHFTNLYTLVGCLTKALDLVSPEITGHHQQVAYLSHAIGEVLGLSFEERRTLVVAALIHDVGAIATDDPLPFDEDEQEGIDEHARLGAELLSELPVLADVSTIIRYHHRPWRSLADSSSRDEAIPLSSRIIHLADRIAVRVNGKECVIGQIRHIKEFVIGSRGTLFDPRVVDAFLKICDRESLWLDLTYAPSLPTVASSVSFGTVSLSLDDTVLLARIFSRVIDFRSPFTAMHSAGVAAAAVKLAELAHMSEMECEMMGIAGSLHDIGKLAIPRSILEKQGRLEPGEFDVIRSHSYYTYRLLHDLEGFHEISRWAAYHHERLDGRGYPFKLDARNLSLGSRVMAVADIFAAITEDRPYRAGMPRVEAVSILANMADNGGISPLLCSLLIENYETVDRERRAASEMAVSSFEAWRA